MKRFGLVLLLALCLRPAAFACSVPVFRYALERWQPSPYELVVIHRGSLTDADREAVRRLIAAEASANVRVKDVDLAKEVPSEILALWRAEPPDSPLPRLVLRYPESGPQVPSVWSGPLASHTRPLFDSPARQAVFDYLTTGRAAVIVLLLSGDAEQDSAARQFLRTEVPGIARRMELPPPSADGPQVQSPVPLRVEFPVVEVPRTAAEDTLVRILTGSEAGLADVSGPIAFPVFGRGRALCSLHGQDLRDPETLRRSLEFLCRACSCQVKELNPGVDLLIAGRWERVLDAQRGPMPRVVAAPVISSVEARGGSGADDAAAARRPPPSGYSAGELDEGPTETVRGSKRHQLATLAAAVLAVITGYWVFRNRRPTPTAQEPR